MDTIKKIIFEKLIPFLATYIVRWSLKFVGSVLTYLGWEQSNYESLIIGVLTFVIGVIWTLIIDKKK